MYISILHFVCNASMMYIPNEGSAMRDDKNSHMTFDVFNREAFSLKEIEL